MAITEARQRATEARWGPVRAALATRTERPCARCKTIKPMAEFRHHRTAAGTPIHRPYCRPCRNTIAREWRKAHGGKSRDRHQRYGIDEETFAKMLADQGGLCAICRQPPSPGTKVLHVDHSHKTGAVRGLLCKNCNTALGLMRESTATFRRAIEYLGATA